MVGVGVIPHWLRPSYLDVALIVGRMGGKQENRLQSFIGVQNVHYAVDIEVEITAIGGKPGFFSTATLLGLFGTVLLEGS